MNGNLIINLNRLMILLKINNNKNVIIKFGQIINGVILIEL